MYGQFSAQHRGFPAELIVELAHAIGRPFYLDKNRGSGGQESLHVSQFDIEGDDMAAGFFQKFQRGRFGSHQFARRENRQMGGHVGHRRMEFLAELFDELPNWIADVRDQCVV